MQFNCKDLQGLVVGRLTVISRSVNKTSNGSYFWNCQCSCGNIKEIVGSDLTRKNRKSISSCGCLARENMREVSYKHGESNTVLHKLWARIKQRCYDKNFHHYKDYGGRGIKMHSEWKNSFTNFRDYILAMPDFNKSEIKNYTLDRKNNNKGYIPGNLKWSTKTQQVNNRRTTLFLYVKGKDIPLSEFAKLKKWSYLKTYRTYKTYAYTL